MKIEVISASARQPDWVRSGFETYSRRIKGSCKLGLTEVELAKRTKGAGVAKLLEQEGRRMLSRVPESALIVALDEAGTPWTTPGLARRLENWMAGGRRVAMLIGGPDGLSPECLGRAEEKWSVSPLTLPHGLVRVVVAEAIYRAWSLLERHPYHRD